MRYILDTNVVCEATARHPEKSVLEWIEAHAHECVISSLTLGEIWKGLHRLPGGKRKHELMRWAQTLENDYSGQWLGLDNATLKTWGGLYARHEARGFQLDVMDSLIAAQALEQGLVVTTRNTADFPPEVKTFNPWNH